MSGKFPPLLAEKRPKERTKCQIENPCRTFSLFSRVSWCRVKREMRYALTARITNYRVQQSAFGAVFQAVNGCAAQPSRKTAHVSGQNRLTLQRNYQYPPL
jgi:hypothetical protein